MLKQVTSLSFLLASLALVTQCTPRSGSQSNRNKTDLEQTAAQNEVGCKQKPLQSIPQQPLRSRPQIINQFYSPGSGTEKTPGIHYWIERKADCGRVTDNHRFKPGESIRLHLRSNVDGHLIVLRIDANNVPYSLFPPLDQIKKYDRYKIKAGEDAVRGGWLSFDPQVTNTYFLVFFSPDINGFNKIFNKSSTADEKYVNVLHSEIKDVSDRQGAKIERDDREQNQVGAYAVGFENKDFAFAICLKSTKQGKATLPVTMP